MKKEIPFDRIRTIFLDYDGTLHNSIKIYGPAFRKSYAYLVDRGLAGAKDWSDKEISYWLGFSPPQMWASFMPHLDEDTRRKCSAIVGEEMRSLTEKGQAQLYDGALETLKYLRDKGYQLVFISNCKTAYKNTHTELFNLGDYFRELVCSEEYDFIPKYEVLKAIKQNYQEEMVIVGDRLQDIEAGSKNGIYTIGCSYGFALEGELEEADFIIDDINDLKKYL